MKNTASFLVLLLIFWSSPKLAESDDNYEYLKVPVDDFVASVNSTVRKVESVISVVSELRNSSMDVRVSHALSHCLDMLDASSEKLNWTLEAVLNPTGIKVGTGDLSSDSRTWLSSVLANQDSCIEEAFRGNKHTINVMMKTSLKKKLKNISSSITKALSMVRTPPLSFSTNARNRTGAPAWVQSKYKRLTKAMAHAVVARDSATGEFNSINEAVNAAPNKSVEPFVIHVKEGIYKEYVVIPNNKWNIVMIGDGMGVTIITGNRNAVNGFKTYNSATFAVKAPGFIGQDMTFENTAGPIRHQAVAFLSDSDLSVLYRCSILGYQDTLYAHSQRQFFKRCEIQGTVDFIFGRSSAVFQDCLIVARKGRRGQKNTITAQGRESYNEISAFTLQFCTITAWPEVIDSSMETYLGRPWKLWSTTMVMESVLSNAIAPQGWLEWAGTYALDTLYYAEYLNRGPGANVSYRVKWPGYHVVTDEAMANLFTVANLLAGNSWLPATGIEYVPGLI